MEKRTMDTWCLRVGLARDLEGLPLEVFPTVMNKSRPLRTECEGNL